jgi:hypothetical protein
LASFLAKLASFSRQFGDTETPIWRLLVASLASFSFHFPFNKKEYYMSQTRYKARFHQVDYEQIDRSKLLQALHLDDSVPNGGKKAITMLLSHYNNTKKICFLTSIPHLAGMLGCQAKHVRKCLADPATGKWIGRGDDGRFVFNWGLARRVDEALWSGRNGNATPEEVAAAIAEVLANPLITEDVDQEMADIRKATDEKRFEEDEAEEAAPVPEVASPPLSAEDEEALQWFEKHCR